MAEVLDFDGALLAQRDFLDAVRGHFKVLAVDLKVVGPPEREVLQLSFDRRLDRLVFWIRGNLVVGSPNQLGFEFQGRGGHRAQRAQRQQNPCSPGPDWERRQNQLKSHVEFWAPLSGPKPIPISSANSHYQAIRPQQTRFRRDTKTKPRSFGPGSRGK